MVFKILNQNLRFFLAVYRVQFCVLAFVQFCNLFYLDSLFVNSNSSLTLRFFLLVSVVESVLEVKSFVWNRA